jgi:spermidine synthase
VTADRLATRRTILYASIAIASSCGMIYELSLGTLASYVLGSSVREFSIVLGLYVSAMGLGAWASSRAARDLWQTFLWLELLVALVGGLSVPLLFSSLGHPPIFSTLLYASVVVIGALVGAELPLLMRVLEGKMAWKDVVGRGLAFDHLGALLASIVFPLALVPILGLVRASALAGVCNGVVAFVGTWALPEENESKAKLLRWASAGSLLLLVVVVTFADAVVARASD